jgi:hypothetical protein
MNLGRVGVHTDTWTPAGPDGRSRFVLSTMIALWETSHPRQKANAWLHYTTNVHSNWFDETGQVVYIVWAGELDLQDRMVPV